MARRNKMAPSSTADAIGQRLDRLLERAASTHAGEEQANIIPELIDLYEVASREADEGVSRRIRIAFVHALESTPDLLSQERYSHFLINSIQPEDYSQLEWQTPDDVVAFFELLYSAEFESEQAALAVRKHASQLLVHVLRQYEDQGDFEKMLRLLQLAPNMPGVRQGELIRLRNRVYLYEMRRVDRGRRLLFAYLLLQLLLIIVVFPLLFVNAENGVIQQQIEEVTDVDLSEPQRQFLSYSDGLYWSLITAASIGYGDVTPRTGLGRVLAATLGVMGVITVGVIAGLVLKWISPRRFD
jgi:hypothetical protein